MSVTIKEVAKEAGTSIGTVSKALNNRPGIRLPLKREIEKIAQRMGYSPYIKSRQAGMYSRSLSYIGIIYAYAGEHLLTGVQDGIYEILGKSDFYELRYNVSVYRQLYNEERKEMFIEKITQDKSIAGVISVFLKLSEANIAKLNRNDMPVVLLNNYSDYGKCVFVDNVEASFKATTALIAAGKKKIGLIMPQETSEQVWQERLMGYKKALAKARIRYDPYLLVYEHTFDLKKAANATKVLLEKEPKINGILYGSDTQAYGGMEALKEMGKRIPEEVAVAGFDDMPFSSITEPPLTSIRQPMREMGKLGAQMLLNAIKKKDFSHQAVKLKTELILRQSTNKDIAREKLLW